MKKYKYIFWDLDGTISDSGEGIFKSIAYAAEHMGASVPDVPILRKFVGPPLTESFEKHFGYSPAEADRAVALFREYYNEKGINENSLYPGMDNLLRKLTDAGYACVLATSKPEPHAREILRRYGIDDCFLYIAGSTFDKTRTTKEQVIAYAQETCGIKDTSQVVMVGDRAHDCVGARKNGIDCIGVLYGYGEREELEKTGVIAIAKDLDELAEFFLK
ncbi:MAG: HAD-IA family hydrolase [Oscillospiraceae bacterium]|nr:HAD-IA family hydrolase [Oscillospiraceae bacterium]